MYRRGHKKKSHIMFVGCVCWIKELFESTRWMKYLSPGCLWVWKPGNPNQIWIKSQVVWPCHKAPVWTVLKITSRGKIRIQFGRFLWSCLFCAAEKCTERKHTLVCCCTCLSPTVWKRKALNLHDCRGEQFCWRNHCWINGHVAVPEEQTEHEAQGRREIPDVSDLTVIKLISQHVYN